MDINPEALAYTPSTGARRIHETPLVTASAATLEGYGLLVDDPQACRIEIVPWPAQGRRPIDPNTGDQGGIAEGLFEFSWQGDILYARNNAVGDSYLFAWSTWPEKADAQRSARRREQALIWRANYHPDGGQLFFPLNGQSFVVPLALPGDEVTPASFTTFYCDGSRGLYLHPNVWHGAIVPHADEAQLLDRQGRVHARVSVNFVTEFDCYLGCSLRSP
jgi:ureidoglycolate lyase